MPETYGTRPLSWYGEQAPDYLDGEEEAELEAIREREEKRAAYYDFLYHKMKEEG